MVAMQQERGVVMRGAVGDKNRKCSLDQTVSFHQKCDLAAAADKGMSSVGGSIQAPEVGHSSCVLFLLQRPLLEASHLNHPSDVPRFMVMSQTWQRCVICSSRIKPSIFRKPFDWIRKTQTNQRWGIAVATRTSWQLMIGCVVGVLLLMNVGTRLSCDLCPLDVFTWGQRSC